MLQNAKKGTGENLARAGIFCSFESIREYLPKDKLNNKEKQVLLVWLLVVVIILAILQSFFIFSRIQ